jgi:hypothetical protein
MQCTSTSCQCPALGPAQLRLQVRQRAWVGRRAAGHHDGAVRDRQPLPPPEPEQFDIEDAVAAAGRVSRLAVPLRGRAEARVQHVVERAAGHGRRRRPYFLTQVACSC